MRLIDADELKRRILEERDKIPFTVPAAPYELCGDKPYIHGMSMRGGLRKALRCMEECHTFKDTPVHKEIRASYKRGYADGKRDAELEVVSTIKANFTVCKECKHGSQAMSRKGGVWCRFFGIEKTEEDFCSRGKRKE